MKMSDLISRSKAMKNYCNALCPKLQKGEYCNDCIIKAWLNNQPTAYDIDKVVMQLNLESVGSSIKESLGLLKAIEIVKQGGVCSKCIEAGNCDVREDCQNMPSNDVCKWEYKHPFGDFPSCRNVNSISRDRNWEFCPYCGKKIKVVD